MRTEEEIREKVEELEQEIEEGADYRDRKARIEALQWVLEEEDDL